MLTSNALSFKLTLRIEHLQIDKLLGDKKSKDLIENVELKTGDMQIL